MNNFQKIGFLPTDILIPKNIDMNKWSVVACDQYTSEPEYWESVEKLVDGSPSTLHITFPEIYLEEGSGDKRIDNINKNMQAYIDNDIFKTVKNSFIYVEREVASGKIRKGLVGAVDLEAYEYTPGAQSLVRATEGTVLDRIPPRVKVRIDAPLELPHVMLLIDDENETVIEPIGNKKDTLEKAYSFELMENSGRIEGYIVPEDNEIAEKLINLSKTKVFNEKYDISDKGVLLFAVGDGNHSLATAKVCWENTKAKLSVEQAKNHPARYALVELVNIHDDSLEFEPIHRVLFECNPEDVIDSFMKYYPTATINGNDGQKIKFIHKNGKGELSITDAPSGLAVGTLQKFLDEYIEEKGGKVDYIHGDDVVESLSTKENNIGFLLPTMGKSELFKTVIIDGVLPRKTFSMGEAKEKRFYLECRKIK